jgi:hypothetical protein
MQSRIISSPPITRPYWVHWLIERVFGRIVIPAYQRWYGLATLRARQRQLQCLPPGTAGRTVADLLAAHGLHLLPGFESHDLKHVLLGYPMTPADELRLKAFMLGNGDWSIPNLALLSLALLTPPEWPDLWRHYQWGRRTPSIVRWRLADYATRNLTELRQMLGTELRAAPQNRYADLALKRPISAPGRASPAPSDKEARPPSGRLIKS